MSDNTRPQKLIEMKLPLTWLIGAVVTVLLALGGLYVKFDSLSTNFAKLDAKTDLRDDRMQTLLQTSVEINAKISAQDARMLRVESDIKDVRADHNNLRNEVNSIRNGQRWMPK